ncbi:MAG: HAD family hydrolase [Rhizobiales bacterium]|nr:HAD family hydrolase [Hyphomicrobiales bacterium]
MPFDAAVFDFDGTLVDSAGAKRDSFFAIFPDTGDHRRVIAGVLANDPDGSRHRVIPRMLEGMKSLGLNALNSADELIRRYGEVSEAAVAAAPELPGASALLAALASRLELHLCSNTPEGAVRAHVAARGWTGHFKTVDGHPATKIGKVATVLSEGGFEPRRVAVIGDGVSDEEAASANGCRFLAIRSPADLAAVGRILGVANV